MHYFRYVNHLTLSEFNLHIKQIIKQNLAQSYWIVCEIGELNLHRNGHCYLELIEKSDFKISAKIRATIWSYTYAGIHRLFHRITGSDLKVGMKVLVCATIEFHEVYGLSLNVQDIDPNYTLGENARKRQETIQKLAQEGIIDLNKSLVLPLVPQRIAVISSSSAAGFGDFVNHLSSNPYGYAIDWTLFEAVMQGERAVASILDQLHLVFEHEGRFDLVVLIRGGGAKLDLDCFDDYDLNAHLAQFPLPIVTGIGHDRDETIADLVANVSLKTPTAVADFIIQGFVDFETRNEERWNRIVAQSMELIQQEDKVLKDRQSSIARNINSKLQRSSNQLSLANKVLTDTPKILIKMERSRLALTEKLLLANDPAKALLRGYTITTFQGKPIDQARLKCGDNIVTKSKNQIIYSQIQEYE